MKCYKFNHSLLSVLVAFVLVLCSQNFSDALAQSSSDSLTESADKNYLDGLRAEWDRVIQGAELSLEELDRSQFILDSLVRKLDRDPQVIFDWVRQNTRWVPYQGALKGPKGVLLARQGNSLDRSLLLAYLLEQAGFDVRITSGAPTTRHLPTLEEAARASLVRDWPGQSQTHTLSEQRLDEVAEKLGITRQQLMAQTKLAIQKLNARTAAIETETRASFEDLKRLLEKAGLQTGTAEHTAIHDNRIIEALKTHYWVQLKTGDESWQDMDLMFESGYLKGLVVIREAAFTPAELPEDLQHSVDIRVALLMQKDTGEVERRVVLNQQVLTSSRGIDEFSVVFSANNTPTSEKLIHEAFDPDSRTQESSQRLLGQSEWVPVLLRQDEIPVFEYGFNKNGDLISDPMGPGRAIARGVDTGTSMLERLGAESQDTQQTNVIKEVRIEIEASGSGSGWSESRVVYNEKTQNDHPPALAFPLALTRASDFLLLTGLISEDYANFMQLERVLQAQLGIRYLLDDTSTDLADFEGKLARVLDTMDLTNPVLYRLAAARPLNTPVYSGFLNQSSILSLRAEQSLSSGEFQLLQTLDIIKNSVAVVSKGTDPIENGFWHAVRLGVADSILETQLFAEDGGSSASRVFSETDTNRWLVFSPGTPIGSDKLDFFAPGTQRLLDTELNNGNWIVLQPGTSGQAYWWRVNPRDGTTLAMVGNGVIVGGSVTTEETMSMWPIIRVMAHALVNAKTASDCVKSDKTFGLKAACIACAAGAFITGFLDVTGVLSSGFAASPELVSVACLTLTS